MNNITITGRTVKISKFIPAEEGKLAICYFKVASNRHYKSNDGTRKSDFISCKAIGKTAESIYKYCGQKKDDGSGKYISRLVTIFGSMETYQTENTMSIAPNMKELKLQSATGTVNGKTGTMKLNGASLADLLKTGIAFNQNGKNFLLQNPNLSFGDFVFKVKVENTLVGVDRIEYLDGKHSTDDNVASFTAENVNSEASYGTSNTTNTTQFSYDSGEGNDFFSDDEQGGFEFTDGITPADGGVDFAGANLTKDNVPADDSEMPF